jgi:hypothetical protein
VPVTLAFEVVDDSGHLLTPERGKVAQRCDATASGLGRTVYLEPLDAPASPTAARVRCTRRPEIRVYCLRDVLSWEHPAANEAGFRIYLESVTWIAGRNGPCRYESQKGPWLLATVADGTTKWTVDYDELNIVVQSAIGSRSRYATTHKLSVAAFDPGGRSPRRKASGAVDYFHDDIPCNTDSLDGYGGA